MRINSTGSVGIGIAPETTYSGHVALEIGQQGTIIANRSADDLSIKINTYLDGSGNWKRKETGVASALDFDGDQIKFFTAASGSADANISFASQLRIDNDGIKFGSDTAAANALDDYEEGTFTPTFSGATLSQAVGSYTKIGNQVTIHYRVVTTGGLPSSGSQVQLGGLPFSISNATINSVASGFGGAGSVYVGPSNVTSAAGGGGTIVTFASGGEAFLRFINVDTGTLGYTLMGELEVSANNTVTAIGTHTYQV